MTGSFTIDFSSRINAFSAFSMTFAASRSIILRSSRSRFDSCGATTAATGITTPVSISSSSSSELSSSSSSGPEVCSDDSSSSSSFNSGCAAPAPAKSRDLKSCLRSLDHFFSRYSLRSRVSSCVFYDWNAGGYDQMNSHYHPWPF